MEIGAGFDDELFEETKQKNCDSSIVEYNVKICEPMWFDDPGISHPDGMHSIYKCRGDMAFYLGDYKKALSCYDTCLDHLYETNVAMWKDVQEARARCYMHLKDQEKATEITQQLVSLASNIDQHTATLYLLADLHRTFKQHDGELRSVQGLLTLHTSNADLWFRLASIYCILHESKCSVNCSCHCVQETDGYPECMSERCASAGPADDYQSGLDEKYHEKDSSRPYIETDVCQHLWMKTVICTCLLHVRCLLRGVQKTLSSFAKAHSLQKLDVINKELAKWNISEEFERKCVQFLYASKEQQDNAALSDSDKVEMVQKLTVASFEDHWFSWH